MNNDYEVISAFLDDEPFDPRVLAEALDDPAGRTLLIDLIGLRRIVQPIGPIPALTPARSPRRFGWRGAAAAAALFVALAGGYLAGQRQAVPVAAAAPAPTRVVQATPFIPS